VGRCHQSEKLTSSIEKGHEEEKLEPPGGLDLLKESVVGQERNFRQKGMQASWGGSIQGSNHDHKKTGGGGVKGGR